MVSVFPPCCGLLGRIERQPIHGAPLTTTVVTGVGVAGRGGPQVGPGPGTPSLLRSRLSLSIDTSTRMIYRPVRCVFEVLLLPKVDILCVIPGELQQKPTTPKLK